MNGRRVSSAPINKQGPIGHTAAQAPSRHTGEKYFARVLAIGGASPPDNFCRTSLFARARIISPLHLPWLPRRQIAIMGAVNHQDVRKPLRIPQHLFAGAKYFSARLRQLVARNRLSVSGPDHLWHGQKIFRPYNCDCYPVARSPPWALSIINRFANLFASPIIHL